MVNNHSEINLSKVPKHESVPWYQIGVTITKISPDKGHINNQIQIELQIYISNWISTTLVFTQLFLSFLKQL